MHTIIQVEDISLLEISLQPTYLLPLVRGNNNSVQAILEDLCRINKNLAVFTASLFFSVANQRRAGIHERSAYNFKKNFCDTTFSHSQEWLLADLSPKNRDPG